MHVNSSLKYLNALEAAGLITSVVYKRDKLFFLGEFLSLL
jgi:hypothetical protein